MLIKWHWINFFMLLPLRSVAHSINVSFQPNVLLQQLFLSPLSGLASFLLISWNNISLPFHCLASSIPLTHSLMKSLPVGSNYNIMERFCGTSLLGYLICRKNENKKRAESQNNIHLLLVSCCWTRRGTWWDFVVKQEKISKRNFSSQIT